MTYVIEFFLFAFLGWILDTCYSSFEKRTFVFSGYFKGIPLCPIYGFGGIVLFNSFAMLSSAEPWITIVVTTILIIILEFFGGWIAEHLLDEKLWDYSNEFLNINGYVSIWHSFLWLLVISGAYLAIGRKTNELLQWFDSLIIVDAHLNVLLLFIILIVGLWLTVKNKKKRLKKLAEKLI